MTPRAVTTGAIRPAPSTVPAPERKPHGRVTDIVRKERGGVTVYEGECDGEPVCIAPAGAVWEMRTRDRLVAAGSLVEVLGVQQGDPWKSPRNNAWRVHSLSTDAIAMYRERDLMTLTRTVERWLADGWRPEASR